MKPYLITLLVGVLVGVIYGALDVRSPAPPIIALVGLLGILVGEQVVPIAKRILGPGPTTLSAITSDCRNHLFGSLPGRSAKAIEPPPPPPPSA